MTNSLRTKAPEASKAKRDVTSDPAADEREESPINPNWQQLAWATNAAGPPQQPEREAEADAAADLVAAASDLDHAPAPALAPLEPTSSDAPGRPRGLGRPLPERLRAQLEPRFGHDLRPVRVHDSPPDAALAQAYGARAYARGHDIVFGAREYQPDTPAGRWSLAHELAHVVQQVGRPSSAAPLGLGGASIGVARQPATAPRAPATADEIEAAIRDDPQHAANLLNGMWMLDMLSTLSLLRGRGVAITSLLGQSTGVGAESDNRVEAAILAVTRSNPARLRQLLAPTGGLQQLQQRLEIRGFLGGAANGQGGTFKSGVLKDWQWIVIGDYVRVGNRNPYKVQGQVVGALPWMAFNPGDLTGDLVKPKDREQQTYIWEIGAIEGRTVRGDLGIFPDEDTGRTALQTWIQKRYAGMSLKDGAAAHLGGAHNKNLVKGVDDPNEYGNLVLAYLNDPAVRKGRPPRSNSTKFSELAPDEWQAVLDAFAEAEDYGNIGLEFTTVGHSERNEHDIAALEAKLVPNKKLGPGYRRPDGKFVAAGWRTEVLRKTLAKIGGGTPPEVLEVLGVP